MSRNEFLETTEKRVFATGREVMDAFAEAQKYWSDTGLLHISEDAVTLHTDGIDDETIILAFLENCSFYSFVEDSEIKRGGKFKFKIIV
jgi:hypothetical protein